MVIVHLLAIELKATLNGNPTNDFYWGRKSSFLNVVQCNTTSRRFIFHRHNLYCPTEKFCALQFAAHF